MVKQTKRFPTFAWLILVIGVLWFLGELNVIAFNVPWLPIVVIVLAIGMILNHPR